jgi:hypothetical protein
MLSNDLVLRIEYSGFAEQSFSFLSLPEQVGFASLLDQFGDSVLACDGDGHAVVVIGGVELQGLFELSLGTGEVLAF